jgi:chromatin modification-related protein VID21
VTALIVDIPYGDSPPLTTSGSDSPSNRNAQVLPNGLVIHPQFANAEELILARKPILDLALTVPTVDIRSMTLQVRRAESPMPMEETEPQVALIDLFPDLAVYSGPAPPEKDKVPKRLNEGGTSSGRLAHTSRIMDIRPVFVSTLRPAENTYDGAWDLHEGPWFEDPNGMTDVPPEVVASTSSVFTGRGMTSLGLKPTTQVAIPQRQSLRHQHVWTDHEDRILLKLVQTYPFNWTLIADLFASELIGIPTDKANAYECYDRWVWKWGEGKGKPRPETVQSAETAAASGPSTAAPRTAITAATPSEPGSARPPETPNTGISVPTLPGQSGPDSAPPPPGLSKREAKAAARIKFEGTKTAVRHQCLYDAVRRLHRKRDQGKHKGIRTSV